ncbi:hypothetical protein [Oryza sativa Japonica Group]|uniref:Uncharacterized protein P0025A05.20 n=1 Tax=Oryza sativa subsp. japonica TaxID=39947 RepID=Q5ZAE8_ORYSJ|nr:hypothetical protein [Oryza sativa Japonica Group]
MCGGEKRGNTRALARLAWPGLACPGRAGSARARQYSIPLAGVHQRSGEQVSGTSAFDVLHREKAAIRFLGSASRDCSLFVRDGSPSSSLACFVPS